MVTKINNDSDFGTQSMDQGIKWRQCSAKKKYMKRNDTHKRIVCKKNMFFVQFSTDQLKFMWKQHFVFQILIQLFKDRWGLDWTSFWWRWGGTLLQSSSWIHGGRGGHWIKIEDVVSCKSWNAWASLVWGLHSRLWRAEVSQNDEPSRQRPVDVQLAEMSRSDFTKPCWSEENICAGHWQRGCCLGSSQPSAAMNKIHWKALTWGVTFFVTKRNICDIVEHNISVWMNMQLCTQAKQPPRKGNRNSMGGGKPVGLLTSLWPVQRLALQNSNIQNTTYINAHPQRPPNTKLKKPEKQRKHRKFIKKYASAIAKIKAKKHSIILFGMAG